MIPDNLGGGLLLCAINLVVVMTVLGVIAWAVGLLSKLLQKFQRAPKTNHDSDTVEPSDTLESPGVTELQTEEPAVEQETSQYVELPRIER